MAARLQRVLAADASKTWCRDVCDFVYAIALPSWTALKSFRPCSKNLLWRSFFSFPIDCCCQLSQQLYHITISDIAVYDTDPGIWTVHFKVRVPRVGLETTADRGKGRPRM